MLAALRTVGDAESLVGSWSITADQPVGHVRVTMWSKNEYRSEDEALAAGGLIVQHFERAEVDLIDGARIRCELEESGGSWRAEVTLTLPEASRARLRAGRRKRSA